MAKFYVAGPMRGYPNFNFDNFDLVRDALKQMGHVAVSPADMDRLYEGWNQYAPADLPVDHELKVRCMARDMNFILHNLRPERGDGICLLHGWQDSMGAKAEIALAAFLGLRIVEYDELVDEYIEVNHCVS